MIGEFVRLEMLVTQKGFHTYMKH